MQENLQILNDWYQSVKGSKNLSLDEAKDLTKKMLQTSNF